MQELVGQLKAGDLAAFFYTSRAEQFSFILPYIRDGLAQNQRCLYIADDTPVGLILSKLEELGVDVESARKRGALDVLTKHETYLHHGVFEPEKMIGDLELDIQASLAKGFSGLRGSGDMGWALDKASTLARMIEYQTKLYERFPPNFVAVCQYDLTRFPDYVVKQMETVHSVLIRDGTLKRRR